MENITPPMPAKRALAALDQPAPIVPPDAPRRISAKVRAAIGLMVSGESKRICDAAEKVGLARESLSRALSTPHVAEHLRQKVLRHLAMAAARAGAVKGELLDSDSEIVRDRASTFVLGLAGIAPASTPSVNLNIEVKAGYVIDLRDPQDRMRDDPRPGAMPGAGMRIVSSTAGPNGRPRRGRRMTADVPTAPRIIGPAPFPATPVAIDHQPAEPVGSE
jgi:hypothetical protein